MTTTIEPPELPPAVSVLDDDETRQRQLTQLDRAHAMLRFQHDPGGSGGATPGGEAVAALICAQIRFNEMLSQLVAAGRLDEFLENQSGLQVGKPTPARQQADSADFLKDSGVGIQESGGGE